MIHVVFPLYSKYVNEFVLRYVLRHIYQSVDIGPKGYATCICLADDAETMYPLSLSNIWNTILPISLHDHYIV